MAARMLDHVAEAGSREVPPAFVVHDEEQLLRKPSSVPTKLFIGGISRHTTTKQLRDHFSQYGEVLDCIAMRGGDGRPRGFGYVTLDSPAAAQRCLREPQLIDNRIVDMKLAVPESGASSKTSFAKQIGMAENMPFNYNYNSWFGADSLDSQSWWNGPSQMPAGQYEQGLDCLQILSQTRDLPSLSAGAPEFVPRSEQTSPEAKMSQSTPSPVKKRVSPTQKRAPLGEITNSIANVFGVDDLLKPFKSPMNKTMGVGHLSGQSSDKSESPLNLDCIAVDRHHMDVHLDENFLDEVQRPIGEQTKSNLLLSPCTSSDEGEDHTAIPHSDGDDASEQVCTRSSSKSSTIAEDNALSLTPEHLPSIGSALHVSGECKRGTFFAKGRCQNGKDCSFCHFSHEVRKPTRQEKRDRRDSKLQARTQHIGQDIEEQDATLHHQGLSCAPWLDYLCPDSLQTHFLGYDHDNDATGDETYAYSILPGLPPVRAMKLPAPLALPTMDALSQAGPALPPGLVTSSRSSFLSKDKATSESLSTTTAIPSTLLSTTPSSCIPLSTIGSRTPSLLSTTPNSLPPSTMEVQAKAVSVSTFGTQTDDDYNCPTCEKLSPRHVEVLKHTAEKCRNADDTRWTREELLKLRRACYGTQLSKSTLCQAKTIGGVVA
jgi:hypothetical protein